MGALPQGGAIMLGKTLRHLIRHGRLTIIRPDGDTEQFGELTAPNPRPDVAIRLEGALTSLKLALHPDLYFGELYVDGALIIERGPSGICSSSWGATCWSDGACRAICHRASAGISGLDASWRFPSRGQAPCGTPL